MTSCMKERFFKSVCSNVKPGAKKKYDVEVQFLFGFIFAAVYLFIPSITTPSFLYLVLQCTYTERSGKWMNLAVMTERCYLSGKLR